MGDSINSIFMCQKVEKAEGLIFNSSECP